MATGGSGTGTGSDGDGEAGEDDPSSSSSSSSILTPLPDPLAHEHDQSTDNKSLLAEFVKEWREELTQHTTTTTTITTNNNNNNSSSSNSKSNSNSSNNISSNCEATEFYKQGMLAESKKQMSEAVKFYQSAYKIDPNIEEKMALFYKNNEAIKNTTTSNECKYLAYNEDMVPDIAKSIKEVGWCVQHKPSSLTHISTVPLIIMIYIMRYVVTVNLDLHLLASISYTCRGFYLLTRSFTLWKRACMIMWPSINTVPMHLPSKYISWRHCYLTSLYLNFHGAYISQVIYTRAGGYSIDLTFCSRLTVTYYRYMRFFTDGLVLLYMTADEPGTVVKKLHNTDNSINLTYGEYQIINKIVQVRSKEEQGRYDVVKEYCFKIRRAKNSMRTYLKWHSYNLIQQKRNSFMVPKTNDFNVKSDCFNNFYFSQVKSYLKGPISIL